MSQLQTALNPKFRFEKTMLSRALVIGLLVMTAAFSLTAEARKKKKVEAPPPPQPDITLVVPQSEMSLPPLLMEEKKPLRLEFDASNWSPSGMRESSYLSGTSDLQSTSLPKLSFNVLATPWTNRVRLSPIYGLAFTQLQRQGYLDFADQSSQVQQSVNLFSLRAGLEVEPLHPYYNIVRPFAALSLMPTLETAVMSSLSNGISRTILATELNAGVSFEIPAAESALGFQDFELEAGLDATTGLTSAFNGFGFLAGTKITI